MLLEQTQLSTQPLKLSIGLALFSLPSPTTCDVQVSDRTVLPVFF